jgi:hypothetical protein
MSCWVRDWGENIKENYTFCLTIHKQYNARHKLVFIWIYIYVCRKIYELILLYYQREIRQNVYPQQNRIRSIFCPYSLPIDSDSVFVSAHYSLQFWIRKNMITNTISLLSVRIRSVFTPSWEWGGERRGECDFVYKGRHGLCVWGLKFVVWTLVHVQKIILGCGCLRADCPACFPTTTTVICLLTPRKNSKCCKYFSFAALKHGVVFANRPQRVYCVVVVQIVRSEGVAWGATLLGRIKERGDEMKKYTWWTVERNKDCVD